jgi:hypothetical protein
MADQIKHGTTEIVSSGSVLKKEALANSGVTAAAYSGSNTHVPSVTVDAKGFITAASTTAVKMTGVDFLASGNTLTDQTIFVNTNAPTASDGADGDVWYHTIS